MSMTKAGANYARHMDEVFAEDDRDYDLEYREYLYLQAHKPAKGAALNSPDNVPAKKQQDGNNVR